MSKDTINPKRWILTQADLDAYGHWIMKKESAYTIADLSNADFDEQAWIEDNPCPLPNPVEIPSDEEIDKTLPNSGQVPMQDGCSYNETCANNTQRRIGAKWLKHLIFNKQ